MTRKVGEMTIKKILRAVPVALAILALSGFTVSAADRVTATADKTFSCTVGDETTKIKLDGTTKFGRKDSNGDTIVKFKLPESITDGNSDWVPIHVEMLMLERLKGETKFTPMKQFNSSGGTTTDERRVMQEYTGGVVELNIGKTQDYAKGASYMIAYRVLMESVYDESIRYWCEIDDSLGCEGGPYSGDNEDANYGWARVIAKADGSDPSGDFIIWVNTDPVMEITGFIKTEDIFYRPPMAQDNSGKYANNILDTGATTTNSDLMYFGIKSEKTRFWGENFKTEGTYDYMKLDSGSYHYAVTSKSKLIGNNIPITSEAYDKSNLNNKVSDELGWVANSTSGYIKVGFKSDSSVNYTAFTLNRVDYWISSTSGEAKYTAGNFGKTNRYVARTVSVRDDDGDKTVIKAYGTVDGTKYEIPVYVNGMFENTSGGTELRYMRRMNKGEVALISGNNYEIFCDLTETSIPSGSDVQLTFEILDDNGGEFSPTLGTNSNSVSYKNTADASISLETRYTGAESWNKNNNAFNATVTGELSSSYSTYYRLNYAVGYIDDIKEVASENRVSGKFVTRLRRVVVRSGSSVLGNTGTSQKKTIPYSVTTTGDCSGEYGVYAFGTDTYGNFVEAALTGKDNAILIDNNKVGNVSVTPSSLTYTNLIPDNSGYDSGYKNTADAEATEYSDSIFGSSTQLRWVNREKFTSNSYGYQYSVQDSNKQNETAQLQGVSGIKEIKYNITKVPETRSLTFDANSGSFRTIANNIASSGRLAGVQYNKGYIFTFKSTPAYTEDMATNDNWVGICKMDTLINDAAAINNNGLTAKKVRGFFAIDNNKPEIEAVNGTGNTFEIEDPSNLVSMEPGVDYVTKWAENGKVLKVKAEDKCTAAGNNLDVSGIEFFGYKITDDVSTVDDSSLTRLPIAYLNTYDIHLELIDRDAIARTGGIKYVHVVAKDKAGNRSESVIKVKINSDIKLTRLYMDDSSSSAIYGDVLKDANAVSDLEGNRYTTYRLKKAIYDTNFRAEIHDMDTTDRAKLSWVLKSNDNLEENNISGIVDCGPDMTSDYSKVFNVIYRKLLADESIADGVYKLTAQVVDYKVDSDYNEPIYFGESYVAYGNTLYRPTENVNTKTATVQVVIKRNNPPEPIITVSDDSVNTGAKVATITYPDEPLAPSLNVSELKNLNKNKYKAVSISSTTGTYVDYTGPLDNITERTEVFAEYTDCVGNVSYATKVIEIDGQTNGEQIGDGNTDVKADENRSTNTYYIGTRKDKDASIDGSSVFNSMK